VTGLLIPTRAKDGYIFAAVIVAYELYGYNHLTGGSLSKEPILFLTVQHLVMSAPKSPPAKGSLTQTITNPNYGQRLVDVILQYKSSQYPICQQFNTWLGLYQCSMKCVREYAPQLPPSTEASNHGQHNLFSHEPPSHRTAARS
jgi:hypothetical protein